ncbi:hypothetical protein HBI56_024190 [Parastagonospora nodorum]|uniref:Uncharacterized protein n=1 Tax=Phaeosphaeria nodorum (strain SN15 / ATCC MYA-4574 / FGSC 10173) TaxID=321614 RepID=A0A7U2F4X6_PHANO|nr:hypothetical protein HBH56_024310 [Parastagonospora nodorum]QRC98784.1 hypothetical protein JI435_061590 [Parastagonospora nodorum SN15]KAH3934167.1 hypothetical protein HBH54_057710 [Parastagonospora nodorum]KAH3949735.1 hypothetical protein HBH53_085400 [Parastagonospora nodorum]KAH3976082.1 hypothetical protein HBH51_079970 [Parastagonospora nodorum]
MDIRGVEVIRVLLAQGSRALRGNGIRQGDDWIDSICGWLWPLFGVPDAKIPHCDCFFCQYFLLRHISVAPWLSKSDTDAVSISEAHLHTTD